MQFTRKPDDVAYDVLTTRLVDDKENKLVDEKGQKIETLPSYIDAANWTKRSQLFREIVNAVVLPAWMV
ncbi:unnamed protein product [Didymodactylos carnosus]|uniref:Uncharacterized protein n=1 Tax=Didymodactylos carnosus TaxID=1234261 RepID=A0A816AB55_9BILA|nr:unnamed protein product [Didymodactylos carnosus]CAF4467092.1 unnamed protein product [Didymodactylos carnosus]